MTCSGNPQRESFFVKVLSSFTCVKMRWNEIRETGNLCRVANDPRNYPTEISDMHYGWFMH